MALAGGGQDLEAITEIGPGGLRVHGPLGRTPDRCRGRFDALSPDAGGWAGGPPRSGPSAERVAAMSLGAWIVMAAEVVAAVFVLGALVPAHVRIVLGPFGPRR